MTLKELEIGESAAIKTVGGSGALRQHFLDMGMIPGAEVTVVKLAPKKVVYVSCNPETLARDLKYLTRHGYQAVECQPCDMFPFTKHVETVCLLSRKAQ